jgi:hypothetical protein
VSPGPHALIVVNPQLSQRRQLEVKVRRGEQRVVRVDLAP